MGGGGIEGLEEGCGLSRQLMSGGRGGSGDGGGERWGVEAPVVALGAQRRGAAQEAAAALRRGRGGLRKGDGGRLERVRDRTPAEAPCDAPGHWGDVRAACLRRASFRQTPQTSVTPLEEPGNLSTLGHMHRLYTTMVCACNAMTRDPLTE